MNYKYLLTIIISTYNRPEKCIRLLNSINLSKNKNIQLVFIDDNSKISYDDLKKNIKKYNNAFYIKSNQSLHKFKNFYKNKNKYYGKYISFIDDKDIFIVDWYEYLKELLIQDDNIIISDMLSLHNNIIGKKFDGNNIHEFLFMKLGYGDKFIIFPNIIFQNYNLNLDRYKNEKIYNLDSFMPLIYFKPVVYVKKPLIIHEYLVGGISDNNIKNKKDNFLWRFDITYKKMEYKSCFLYKILKCFEMWIIRENVKVRFPSIKYYLLYSFLKYFYLFPLINYFYKKKLKKVIDLNN